MPRLWLGTLWLSCSAVLCAEAVVAGSGYQRQRDEGLLRQRDEGLLKYKPPLKVNPRADTLEFGSVGAKIDGSRKRAVAALVRARAAQARSNALEMYVEQLKLESESKTSILQDMASQASTQSAQAEAKSSQAVKAYKSMKTSEKKTIADAGKYAVEEVQKMFSQSFDDLGEWREEVLRDTHEDAKRAASVAAEPYQRMTNVFTDRTQAYIGQANSWALQANKAFAESKEMAAEAQKKMNGGDAIGANQDLEAARSMHEQAAELAQKAKTLQATAVKMNQQRNLYIAATSAASARARYDNDPDAMPPLPLDPNTAYTPPPPPPAQ